MMKNLSILLVASLCLLSFSVTYAQDPASSWLAYAKGLNPNGGSSLITRIEAKWVVPDVPKVTGISQEFPVEPTFYGAIQF